MDKGLLFILAFLAVAALVAKLRPKGYQTQKSVIQQVTPFIANIHFNVVTYRKNPPSPLLSNLELCSDYHMVNYWCGKSFNGSDQERITIRPHNNTFFLELFFADGKVSRVIQDSQTLELNESDNYNVHQIAQAVRNCLNA
jgi:hypothetical protein